MPMVMPISHLLLMFLRLMRERFTGWYLGCTMAERYHIIHLSLSIRMRRNVIHYAVGFYSDICSTNHNCCSSEVLIVLSF
jgi:hypothetical protein